MKKLLYGWHGEFGWEVMTVVPEINALRKMYDITLVGYADTVGMYSNMISNFVPHNFDFRICGKGPKVDMSLWNPIIKQTAHDAVRIHGTPAGTCTRINFTPVPCEIREDIVADKRAKICVHSRKFPYRKTGRNWLDHNFETVMKLKEAGYEIVFIGHPEYSAYKEGYGIDARGDDMESTIRHIKESIFTFGPASGPSVLSQWCRTPVFTWSCGDLRLSTDDNRETRKWNPLKTDHFHPWSEIDRQRDRWEKTYKAPVTAVDQKQIESGLAWTIAHLNDRMDIDLPKFTP